MKSIGLLIIVKDEEQNIPNALSSAYGLFDQIVVVDTGSNDKTTSIASKFGAEIHYFEWIKDFSAARNYGIKAMRTDWIMTLDADEEINRRSFLAEKDLINDDNLGGLNCEIINDLNQGEQKSKHRYTRIFRNNPYIRFEGKIHEQIRESIENQNLKIAETKIKINHFGYSDDTEEKGKRNLEILENELKGNEGDAWLRYHTASTEFSLGNLHKSKELFESIFNSDELSLEQNEIVTLRLAQISLSEEDLSSVENYTSFVSNDKDREGLRLFIKAALHMIKKEFSEALSLYSNDILRNSDLVEQGTVGHAVKFLKQHIG